MKIVKITGSIILGIFIIGLVVLLLFNSTVHPKNIFVSAVNVSDSKITLKGTFTDSAILYKGYKAEYKNSTLYIKIKGGLFSFSNSKDLNLSIINKYGKIKEIYLQDDSSSGNVLIFPRS